MAVILDLFAGIGGFSLAAHWMGWETAAFVEKEPFCQKVLRKNFGQDIEIHNDIFKFAGEPFRGRVDIVTGGFPCQPFSAAGKRKGRNDERHLFPEMLRVIREVQPRWVIAENVRGLLSIESGRVFSEVVASLESESYEVITFCVPASALGAPHRRDRLWIVAHSDSDESGLQGKQERGSERIWSRHQRHDFDVRDSTSADGGGCGFRANEFRGTGCSDVTANPNTPVTRGMQEREGTEYAGNSVRYCGTADTESIRFSGCIADSRLESAKGQRYDPPTSGNGRSGWNERWIDVAARTCVRGMDDALSNELDIIGSRDNRVHRLKALGNSVVPLIPYEIFRAIEASEL